MTRTTILVLTMISAACLPLRGSESPAAAADPLAWPPATSESRPWTRWWWLGSAVDAPNLTHLLEQYHAAGIGGVEICPIYGAKGYENRYVDFLSPQWMKMLAHTTSEAKRLGMGVDLTTGTGWPFGGPQVDANHASAKVVLKAYDVAGGTSFEPELPAGKLQCLRAVSRSEDAKQVDLPANQPWTAPPGKWRVYAVLVASPVQKVKRAAPGGEGNVLDPYSVGAMNEYLAAFDKAFEGFSAPMPRSEFHDSFEYYGATWTPDFFEQFQKCRGYDLRTRLPALFGEGDDDTVARVKCDYRQTLSDLHLAYIQRWTEWSHAHGSRSRNQAHGAPGNLIDLYAAADIPETEIFGSIDEKHIPMHKMASSAAHLSGRTLSSSESFTWLGEHFQVSLADVKPAADFLFLSGVNHILFHGIPYSPQDAPWPGWLFYAAVNFGPNGGLWHDLPAFNAYVARVQSILQSGKPASDVLLYWPIHDTWQAPDGLMMQFTVHDQSKWLWSSAFYKSAMELWTRGYTFDEVSDALVADAKVVDGKIDLGGNDYRVIVVPQCKYVPVATMKKLIDLARAGATVIVQGILPSDVPGFRDFQHRREQLGAVKEQIKPLGDRFITAIDTSLDEVLTRVPVSREPMVDQGLRFVRRSREGGGHDYFVVNRSEKRVDGWVTLGTGAASAAILDPLFDDRAGVASVQTDPAARGLARIYLQLDPGESRIVRTSTSSDALNRSRAWRYDSASGGGAQSIGGTWQIHFLEGGPALPKDFQTTELSSWTTRDDPEAKRFAGTARYTIDFDRPPAPGADDWLLDLGKVCESARVKLNGNDVATLWCQPFSVRVGKFLRDGKNTLELDVTNLAANRIADLDRRGVNWKAFHEINFVNKSYKPFDASHWALRDSGLLGPVRLIPLRLFNPS